MGIDLPAHVASTIDALKHVVAHMVPTKVTKLLRGDQLVTVCRTSQLACMFDAVNPHTVNLHGLVVEQIARFRQRRFGPPALAGAAEDLGV